MDQLKSENIVRVMTYNVHGCRGVDRKISPERIAKVIGQYEPDIVALQELDLGRKRSDEVDQPHMIAKQLEMIYHFHPTIKIEEEQYGNAVLSRFPLKLIKAQKLPSLTQGKVQEPRGAIWASVDINGQEVQLINTHLGLKKKERSIQIEAIKSEEFLAHPDCQGAVIFCGDLNSWPKSSICKSIREVLKDVQDFDKSHKPLATWYSHIPISRIDHVFVSPKIKVVNVEVPRTWFNKSASDHLPLIVDIQLEENLNG